MLFATFAVVERRPPHPLVDFSFFRRRNFTGATIVVFVLDFSFGALLFFLPLYFQEILGYSPTEIGVLLLPLTGLMVVGSPLGGRVAARVGPRPPIVIGLALMTAAVPWISTLTLDTGYAQLWIPSALMAFGVGFALTPMNLAAMNAISRDHAGAASGLLVTLSRLGATLGVAVTGATFNELQTERTISRTDDLGVDVTRAQAQQLDGLLAGAADAQQSLARIAGDKAGAVGEAVREAFVDALSFLTFDVFTASMTGNVVLLGIAVSAESGCSGRGRTERRRGIAGIGRAVWRPSTAVSQQSGLDFKRT